MLTVAWLWMLACTGAGTEPVLEVTSPSYGAFLGYGPIVVRGRVEPADLEVTVEGQPVEIGADGEFFYALPWEDRYRCVDVRAFDGDGEVAWERVPVFDGQDPEDSWTDGLTGRVSPAGLARMGPVITDAIGDVDWETELLASIEPLNLGPLTLTPTGLTSSGTSVTLAPDYEGLAVTIALADVVLEVDVLVEGDGGGFEGPGTLRWDELGLFVIGEPDVDFDGIITLELEDPAIVSEGLDVDIEGADEAVVAGVEVALSVVDDWLAEPLLGLVTTASGALELGGPLEFSTELGSSTVAFALTDLDADRHGLGAEIAVDFDGEEIEDFRLDIPEPEGELPSGETFHMAVGLHEYLLDEPVTAEITALLDQDIELDGGFADLVLWWIEEIPGSSQIPDGDGWCLNLDPGEASVLRLAEGTDPLAVLYLPDAKLTAGRLQGNACEDWLVMSLALEAGLVASGDRISMEVEVGDGAVIYYGAEGQEDEEVVAAIREYLGDFLGLIGAVLRIDISDILEGLESKDGTALDALEGLGELDLAIVDSVALDEYGEPIEGAYGVALRIWAQEAD